MSKQRKARHAGLVLVREPSGRLSRATMTAVEGVSPTQAKRLRDAAVRGMADPIWGTELGYLFMAGKLKSELYEAGRRWARLVIAYYKALGATPPYPKAQNFEHYEPSQLPELSDEEMKHQRYRVRAVVQDMREAHAVLLAAGRMAECAVRMLCEDDHSPVGTLGHMALERGLLWLASHWGLTDERLRR